MLMIATYLRSIQGQKFNKMLTYYLFRKLSMFKFVSDLGLERKKTIGAN